MPQRNKTNLSIIIPVYNEEKYLNLLFHDLKKYFNESNIEVIVVNDGSSDNSRIILEDISKNKFKFNYEIINLQKNYGKGYAVRVGARKSKGNFLLLQDADLELDLKDSREMYDTIQNDKSINCLFGSRYLSGKLKKHNYFINELIGKFNTLIFNILFGQSLTDVHCGLKIINRKVYDSINLSINDFGLEIDMASQIIKNNYYIYEVGVSYFSRTVKYGKKITWIDGLKSYYYLFKVRFIDNSVSTLISIFISAFYMTYFGSYFGNGIEKFLFMILFFISGMIIGLHTKIISTLFIFLFICIGSLFTTGNLKFLIIYFFLVTGTVIIIKLRKKINQIYPKSNNLF